MDKKPIEVNFGKLKFMIDRNDDVVFVETLLPDDTNRSVIASLKLEDFLDGLDEMYLDLSSAQQEEEK